MGDCSKNSSSGSAAAAGGSGSGVVAVAGEGIGRDPGPPRMARLVNNVKGHPSFPLHESYVVNGKIRETDASVDLEFVCLDGQVRAHKIILALASPFIFRLCEGQSNDSTGLTKIIVPDMPVATVRNIISLAYMPELALTRQEMEDVRQYLHLFGFSSEHFEYDGNPLTAAAAAEYIEDEERNIDVVDIRAVESPDVDDTLNENRERECMNSTDWNGHEISLPGPVNLALSGNQTRPLLMQGNSCHNEQLPIPSIELDETEIDLTNLSRVSSGPNSPIRCFIKIIPLAKLIGGDNEEGSSADEAEIDMGIVEPICPLLDSSASSLPPQDEHQVGEAVGDEESDMEMEIVEPIRPLLDSSASSLAPQDEHQVDEAVGEKESDHDSSGDSSGNTSNRESSEDLDLNTDLRCHETHLEILEGSSCASSCCDDHIASTSSQVPKTSRGSLTATYSPNGRVSTRTRKPIEKFSPELPIPNNVKRRRMVAPEQKNNTIRSRTPAGEHNPESTGNVDDIDMPLEIEKRAPLPQFELMVEAGHNESPGIQLIESKPFARTYVYPCNKCKGVTYTMLKAREHFKICNPDQDESTYKPEESRHERGYFGDYKCQLCQRSYMEQGPLTSHMRKIHPESSKFSKKSPSNNLNVVDCQDVNGAGTSKSGGANSDREVFATRGEAPSPKNGSSSKRMRCQSLAPSRARLNSTRTRREGKLRSDCQDVNGAGTSKLGGAISDRGIFATPGEARSPKNGSSSKRIRCQSLRAPSQVRQNSTRTREDNRRSSVDRVGKKGSKSEYQRRVLNYRHRVHFTDLPHPSYPAASEIAVITLDDPDA